MRWLKRAGSRDIGERAQRLAGANGAGSPSRLPARCPYLLPCSPPAQVTFNTLIDVYGKMGSWEEAVNVLALMKSEGVEPVLRTFK